MGAHRFAGVGRAALLLAAMLASSACGARRSQEERPGMVVLPDAPLARAWPRVLLPARAQPTRAEFNRARHLAAFARELRLRRAAARAGDEPPLVLEGVDARLGELLARAQGKAQASVCVRDLSTGARLFGHQPELPLIPASNQKVVTAAAALDLLGPDYVFETQVYADASSLYLVGGGDPTIDTRALSELARQVARGMRGSARKQLEAIIVDDSAFTQRRLGPGYADDGTTASRVGAAYVAPSGALSLNFNTVELEAKVVAGQERPATRLLTASSHVVVTNRARVGPGPTSLELRSTAELPAASEEGEAREFTRLTLTGVLSRSQRRHTIRRRVVDPGLYAGTAFALQFARASHTKILPVRRGRLPDPAVEAGAEASRSLELVGSLHSAPLHEVVGRMLSYSNNFMAEQLLRTLGGELSEEPGGWGNGAAVLRAYWELVGNPPAQLHFVNGSGFSSEGRVSSAGLVELLYSTTHSAAAPLRLSDALSAAGSPGTLAERLARAGRRVRAKTGTLGGASGLTGVISDRAGEPRIAFSIVLNANEDAGMGLSARRALEDAIVLALLELLDAHT